MHAIERVVLYTGVGAALTLGGLSLAPESVAHADNHGSHAAASPSVASLDVFAIVESLLNSDRYEPARTAETEVFNTRLAILVEEINTLGTQLQTMDTTTPDAQAIMSTYNTKRQEYQQVSQEARVAVETLYLAQMIEAYNTVVETAQGMAEQHGHELVLASRVATRELEGAGSVSAVLQEMLARSILYGQEAIDLTDMLKNELGLPLVDEVETGEADADAAGPEVMPAEGTDDSGG